MIKTHSSKSKLRPHKKSLMKADSKETDLKSMK